MDEDDVTRFRGLNMNHGFIRSIVKNQIDRDEYHRVMEERKAEVRDKVRESKRRNKNETSPKKELYIPPHLRCEKREEEKEQPESKAERSQIGPSVITDSEESNLREKVRNRVKAKMDDLDDLSIPSSSTSGRKKEAVKQVFLLNMKNNDGEEVEIPVLSTDSAARLAKQLGRKYQFNDEQCRMLRLTLDQALKEHGAS